MDGGSDKDGDRVGGMDTDGYGDVGAGMVMRTQMGVGVGLW